MMSLAQITEKIHAETGYEGAELEAAVHFYGMMYAALVENKAAEAHFASRCKDALRRAK
jgi:hypothetical protein